MKNDLNSLIGKTIADIKWCQLTDNTDRFRINIEKIIFTDGSFIRLNVVESENDYIIEPTIGKS